MDRFQVCQKNNFGLCFHLLLLLLYIQPMLSIVITTSRVPFVCYSCDDRAKSLHPHKDYKNIGYKGFSPGLFLINNLRCRPPGTPKEHLLFVKKNINIRQFFVLVLDFVWIWRLPFTYYNKDNQPCRALFCLLLINHAGKSLRTKRGKEGRPNNKQAHLWEWSIMYLNVCVLVRLSCCTNWCNTFSQMLTFGNIIILC